MDKFGDLPEPFVSKLLWHWSSSSSSSSSSSVLSDDIRPDHLKWSGPFLNKNRGLEKDKLSFFPKLSFFIIFFHFLLTVVQTTYSTNCSFSRSLFLLRNGLISVMMQKSQAKGLCRIMGDWGCLLLKDI